MHQNVVPMIKQATEKAAFCIQLHSEPKTYLRFLQVIH